MLDGFGVVGNNFGQGKNWEKVVRILPVDRGICGSEGAVVDKVMWGSERTVVHKFAWKSSFVGLLC
jgi:hypothetical protein